MKSFSDAQYAFKAAFRRAVQMAGGCNAAANVTRVDAARLSRYGNIDAPEFGPVDVGFDLDVAAGDDVILRAWADLRGFDLSPRKLAAIATDDLTHMAGQVAKEAGEVISKAIEAGADGVLSPNEAREIDEEAADLQNRVVKLRSIARSAMGGRQS
jgi:hypothetical protein